MTTIAIDVAQAIFDEYLARVEAGETFIITVDSMPTARLIPPSDNITNKVLINTQHA